MYNAEGTMMKYMNTTLVLLPVLLSVVPLWSSDVPCSARLLIENKSGWAITFFYTTVAGGQMEQMMRQGEKMKELDTCLDKIATMSFKRRGQVWGLYAKTVSLDAQLQLLQGQLRSNPKKDGIIVIDATMTDWKVSTRWEGAVRGSLVMPEEVWEEEKVPVVVKPKPQASVPAPKPREMLVTLPDVQQGELGAQYVQKVADIMNTDYAHAEKKGKVNLKTQLIREFSDVTVATTKDMGDTLESTRINSEDAKNSIDRLTRVLSKYRSAGWVK
jgi:hypothetical protein